LLRQQIQDWLLAAVQNVKKLIGHGPRPASEPAEACPQPRYRGESVLLSAIRDVFAAMERIPRILSPRTIAGC